MFPWEAFCAWKKKSAAAGSVCQAHALLFLLLQTQPYQSHFDHAAALSPLLFFLLLTRATHGRVWGFWAGHSQHWLFFFVKPQWGPQKKNAERL